MFSSKVIYFISAIAILGVVSDVALARPGNFEDEINRVDSEDFPEDYKAVLDIDEEIRNDKVEDDDEIIELVDNDAVEEVSDEDVEVHEIPGADEEEAAAENSGEEEADDDIAKAEESSAEDEGKRHENDEGKEDDDEIIEIEEEVLSEDQDENEAEAAWYEKIRQYFAKLGKK